jgi:hypothetical protein
MDAANPRRQAPGSTCECLKCRWNAQDAVWKTESDVGDSQITHLSPANMDTSATPKSLFSTHRCRRHIARLLRPVCLKTSSHIFMNVHARRGACLQYPAVFVFYVVVLFISTSIHECIQTFVKLVSVCCCHPCCCCCIAAAAPHPVLSQSSLSPARSRFLYVHCIWHQP